MKKISLLLSIFIMACVQTTQTPQTAATEPAQAELEQGFQNPPSSAEPHTWWHWMNGNISKEGITADLEAMAEAGLGGAQIFNVAEGIPHGGVQFNSPEWIDMVVHASREAERLGLELCIHNCAGWANSGGPWNTPEHGMKFVITSELQVVGPTKLDSIPSQPEAHPDFYQDIAVLAFRTPAEDTKEAIRNFNGKVFRDRTKIRKEEAAEISSDAIVKQEDVIDVSKYLLAGTSWDVPEGDWTVLRIGYTANGRKNHPAPTEGTGLEVDKLSREAVKAHWDAHLGRIVTALGSREGSNGFGLNNVLIDSYEVGTQNWTQGFEKEFAKRTGYDITKISARFVRSHSRIARNHRAFPLGFSQGDSRHVRRNLF